jgi:hypothetical protein
VSNTIRNDIEQVTEDEKRDEPGHQTGDDRGGSTSVQKEQVEGDRADTHKRQSFGRNPYDFSYRHIDIFTRRDSGKPPKTDLSNIRPPCTP